MDSEGRLHIERELRRRLEGLGPAARVELLRALTLPDKERPTRIGILYGDERTRTMAELLMDLEEDPAGRGVVIAELRMMERKDPS